MTKLLFVLIGAASLIMLIVLVLPHMWALLAELGFIPAIIGATSSIYVLKWFDAHP